MDKQAVLDKIMGQIPEEFKPFAEAAIDALENAGIKYKKIHFLDYLFSNGVVKTMQYCSGVAIECAVKLEETAKQFGSIPGPVKLKVVATYVNAKINVPGPDEAAEQMFFEWLLSFVVGWLNDKFTHVWEDITHEKLIEAAGSTELATYVVA